MGHCGYPNAYSFTAFREKRCNGILLWFFSASFFIRNIGSRHQSKLELTSSRRKWHVPLLSFSLCAPFLSTTDVGT